MCPDTESDKFFDNPHVIKQQLGKFTVTAELKVPKDFPSTSSAMASVAEAEDRDDESRKKGFNNYSLSLEKLMDAFDSFIREYSKGKHSAGFLDNYNLLEPCELTISLIWILRNTWAHKGGVIDDKCIKDYTNVFELSKGTKPIIKLPRNLQKGNRFKLEHDDYYSIKNCIFKYIEKRVSKEDYYILHTRSGICNMGFESKIYYPFVDGMLVLDIAEASKNGFTINLNNRHIKPPRYTKYDFSTNKVLLRNGKSFYAEFLSIGDYYKRMLNNK